MGGNKKVSWTDADAQCPFFISEYKRTASVSCEGHDQDTRISIRFKNLRARDRFMGHYCCKVSGYRSCPYYSFLTMFKYSGD